MMNKIILYIMTKKGLEVLRRAAEINMDIIDYIVVGTDSNIENDFSKQIIELAQNANIKFFMQGEEPIPDKDKYIFAISWRWIINHPVDKLIVFHDSLLPKYRGFAPLVNMLINGEKNIGVTALFGASEYDKGNIILQKSSKIDYPIKICEAIELNIENYISLAEEIISALLDGKELKGIIQDEKEATYSIWRDEDDYKIDWSKSSDEIKRLIDAIGYPYSGAITSNSKGERIRILDAEIIDDVFCEVRHPGKVIFINKGIPTVICGQGLLQINEAYYAGTKSKTYLPMKSFRVKFE